MAIKPHEPVAQKPKVMRVALLVEGRLYNAVHMDIEVDDFERDGLAVREAVAKALANLSGRSMQWREGMSARKRKASKPWGAGTAPRAQGGTTG